MQFSYKAKSTTGEITEGSIEAPNEKDATKMLGERNLFVLELNNSDKSSFKSFSFKKKVSLKDKIIFTKELAMMTKGGLPIVEALKALEEQAENPVFAKAIGDVVRDVQGGTALSKALTKHPKIFPKIYCAIVASGESSGKLDEVLNHEAEQLQKDYDLMSKVKNAISYPIIVVVALVGVLILMLVFVVPQLRSIFSEMGVDLPLLTRILLDTSMFLVTYWYLVILVISGIYAGYYFYQKTSNGRRFFDMLKIKMVIFGPLIKKIYMARFTRTTATLVASGLPMLEILKIVQDVIGNKIYFEALDQVYKDVESGVKLSNALRKHKIFPPMVCQMVTMGEKSGKVDEVLFNVADFYDKEVEASTSGLTSMIEPILIIIIGVGVGAAIASVILPIYSLVKTI